MQISGVGIHTGQSSRVIITESSHGAALVHNNKLLMEFPLHELQNRSETQIQSQRSTLLHYSGGTLRTPEHLFAVLPWFRTAPFEIRIEGDELPALDGSAREWYQVLKKMFPSYQLPPDCYECNLEWSKTWNEGFIRVSPSDCFKVDYQIDRPWLLQQAQLDLSEVQNSQTFFDARTFINKSSFYSEQSAQILCGAAEGRGILIDDSFPDPHSPVILSGAPFRMNNECAWHKISDLVGDLALFSLQLPKLRVEIKNGGHAVHHELIKRIYNNVIHRYLT
jgi:UDP-3-O-[3-hydroxymyristoyl] N-acetylglucosamine deacetylase